MPLSDSRDPILNDLGDNIKVVLNGHEDGEGALGVEDKVTLVFSSILGHTLIGLDL